MRDVTVSRTTSREAALRGGAGVADPLRAEPQLARPLRPLITDDIPAADELGEIVVITRELPERLPTGQLRGVFERYEADLERLLSTEAWGNVVEVETSATAIRWVVRVSPTEAGK